VDEATKDDRVEEKDYGYLVILGIVGLVLAILLLALYLVHRCLIR